MKKIIMTLIVTLMFVFTAAPALAGDHFSHRMKTHIDRIEEGVRDGSLTGNEIHRLYRFHDLVSWKINQFGENDGRIDEREASIIFKMQDRMGNYIYQLKHNDNRAVR